MPKIRMEYNFKFSKKRLELYDSFHPDDFSELSQIEKEQLVKDTIIQICKDKGLPEDIPVFFTYKNGELGSFNCHPVPHINITMNDFTDPYELLEAIIHEMRHYEQYETNKDKDNEIIRGIKFPLEDLHYRFQKHEMDAYEYTFAELKAAASINKDLEKHANKSEKDYNVRKRNEATQAHRSQKMLEIEVPFVRKGMMKKMLKFADYLSMDMFGKREHYIFNVNCPALSSSNVNKYSVEYRGVAGKTIFSLTENDKHISVIMQGDQANIFFASNQPFDNFKEMISIAASFVNNYNQLNKTKIDTLKIYPEIEGLNKLNTKIFRSINEIDQMLEIKRIPLNNEALNIIKEEMGRQFFLLVTKHRINSNGVEFMATNENLSTDKASERINDFLKGTTSKNDALICKHNGSNFLTQMQEALMSTYKNHSIGFNVDAMTKENIKNFLMKNNIIYEDKLDKIIEYNKDYNERSEYYNSREEQAR